MPVNRDFKDLFSALNAADARYLVVGGYAVMHYTEPRYTKDLDVWVEPTADNAQHIMKALADFGAPIADLTIEDLCNPDLVFQVGVEPNRIDILMGVDAGPFDECWSRANQTFYGGVPIRVLALEDLIRAKEAAGRPQDRLDVERLREAKTRGRWRGPG
jgi:hypothetical protein